MRMRNGRNRPEEIIEIFILRKQSGMVNTNNNNKKIENLLIFLFICNIRIQS
jgi:hypothetical protein